MNAHPHLRNTTESRHPRRRPNVAIWFEIPRAEFERAVSLYERLFDVTLRREACGSVTLAVFPSESSETCDVALSLGPDGPAVRLEASGGLDALLAQLMPTAGEAFTLPIKLPMGTGTLAVVRDSEGNRIGLQVEG